MLKLFKQTLFKRVSSVLPQCLNAFEIIVIYDKKFRLFDKPILQFGGNFCFLNSLHFQHFFLFTHKLLNAF